jgi:hypothetical protein
MIYIYKNTNKYRFEVSAVLDVSGHLGHDCSERHFGYILTLIISGIWKVAACLGFRWAATFVETGLDAFNESSAREPSFDRQQRPAAFRHSAVEAAGCAVRALDTSRFVNYGGSLSVRWILARPYNSVFCVGFWHLARITHKWKNAIFHSHISLLFI